VNWGQFQKNIGMRVQIEPPACWLEANGHVLPERHDDWLIENIGSNEAVVLRNLTTDHVVELGKDHIYDYRSNPFRSKNGLKHGFLILKVQVFVQGVEAWLRPNARPGERVAPSNRPHHKVQWTPFAKVDASTLIPPNAPFASIQYRLWSDEEGVPLLIRIAAQQDGALTQELSGPSGVAEQMITENQTFYVSFSHPRVQFEIGVLGYKWE